MGVPERHLVEEVYNELVVIRDIGFRSRCRHHLLPFAGVVHVGFVPGDRPLLASTVVRVVDRVARRPPVHQRLAAGVADGLVALARVEGVGVVVVAERACMTPGDGHEGSSMMTSALRGVLRTDARTRHEFLAGARVGAGLHPRPVRRWR